MLEFSPVLSENDLLEIIRSSPVQGALSAISRRRGLSGPLSDAIVGTGDTAAVTALLANDSAQIREETLDIILDKAPTVPAWHEPLVLRPRLSPQSARRIAGFVAMQMLDRLQRRLDLDDETLAAVAETVEERIAHETPEDEDPEGATPDEAAERVAALKKKGKLDGAAIDEGLSRGDRPFVVLALAELSGIAPSTIEEVAGRRAAKGLVAITWKAALTPKLASQIQAQLAAIPPDEVLKAEDGDWPMSEADMEWQAAFFEDPDTRS